MKNNMISKLILASSIALASSVLPTQAAQYKVDVEGAHAFKYDTFQKR
ncbi:MULTISPECIES: hypothetical protein [unclassified Pseudoalteromonas]|nr:MULTISPECIES: hypothetical protein [unclassified Pseudoalteromonas]